MTVARSRGATRSPVLAVTVALGVAGITLALLGVASTPVTAQEFLGAIREPGEPAFVAGHRGDSESAPENTISAVRAAIDGGFDYVEVDIALTADDVAVLMHDDTVDRTTNGVGVLADLTYDEVRTLDAGSWFGSEFAGEPVPSAHEFLDVIAGTGARALVELKGEWSPESVSELVVSIEERGLERRIALASFDARPLALAAAESDVIARIAILRDLPEDVVTVAGKLGVGGIIVRYSALAREPEFVDALHEAGFRVMVYTLNDGDEWEEALQLGVDGIITDAPAGLSEWQGGA